MLGQRFAGQAQIAKPSKNSTTVGVIGTGAFGSFIVSCLLRGVQAISYDVTHDDDAKLERVLESDIIILAIPLASYDTFLKQAANRIVPETLVIDVCSVKTVAAQKLDKYLPNHPNLLITHPLFGPQSAAHSTKGHTLVVTQKRGERADQVLRYCVNELELQIVTMTHEAHDKGMAQVHALTFFAARGLDMMQLPEMAFTTPSYQKILNLAELDSLHSEELFRTIQLGNPYAQAMRTKYIETLQKVDDELRSI